MAPARVAASISTSRLRDGASVTRAVDEPRAGLGRGAAGVLGAALLFNLGQGVLRPTLPLYLQQVFAANYRMVTAIPTVFGAGKWIASLPTGYLLGLAGRRLLMVSGLLIIAVSDVARDRKSTRLNSSHL